MMAPVQLPLATVVIVVVVACHLLSVSSVQAADGACLNAIQQPEESYSQAQLPVNCTGIGSPSVCLLLCGVCTTPALRAGLSIQQASDACKPTAQLSPEHQQQQQHVAAVALITTALLNTSAMQGEHWLNSAGAVEANATACLSHLVEFMPVRDVLLLLEQPYQMLDFLIEHIRYALYTRAAYAFTRAVPWDVFLDAVLPYAFLDEPRDLWWRWRPRFHQLFQPLLDKLPASNTTLTDAVHAVVANIPWAMSQGALLEGHAEQRIVPGRGVVWKSETAPARLSPRQVVAFGGSCTGTAVVLGASLRAAGLPVRLAGCSESIVRNDDHHWVEFYDGAAPGPFGDHWHTKEGVSQGNSGGPWDSPSAPMKGCLKGVVPLNRLETLWATSWSSPTFLPTLWHSSRWAATWGHVGGINRCGAYCTAWGCGVNQTQHWSQQQCAPVAP